MGSFLQTSEEARNLLLYWKAGLQLEQAFQTKLIPVLPKIAALEGRPYSKIPFDKNQELELFLLRQREQFELPVTSEEIPFIRFLQQKEELAKRFKRNLHLDLYLGFPAILYYDQQNRKKLTTLFKFNLTELKYPSTHEFSSEGENPSFLSGEQKLPEINEFPILIDDYVLEELLEIQPEIINAWRRQIRKNKNIESILLETALFLEKLSEKKEDLVRSEFIAQDSFKAITKVLQNYAKEKKLSKINKIYSFHLLYIVDERQPTRQLQNDLDDLLLLDLAMDFPTNHPAYFYLFGNNLESSRQSHLLTCCDKNLLTDSQSEIVQSVMDRRYSVVHGPPGSGKTHLIRNIAANRFVEHVKSLPFPYSDPDENLWSTVITGTNNHAVDQAIAGLNRENLLPFTICFGNLLKMNRVTAPMLEQFLQELATRDVKTEMDRHKELYLEFTTAYKERRQASDRADDHLYHLALRTHDAWVGANQGRVTLLLQKLSYEVSILKGIRCLYRSKNTDLLLQIFPVVGCTLLSLRNIFQMEERVYGMTIIDEAGQCPPSYVFPALARTRLAVFIGDVYQLEPITLLGEQDWDTLNFSRENRLSRETRNHFLNSSVNMRSAQHIALESVKNPLALQEHFRCHQEIIDISIDLCRYSLQVVPFTVPSYPILPKVSLWYRDVQQKEEKYEGSWYNIPEVEAIVQTVQHLMKSGISPGDIVILTPYVGQLRYILRQLKKHSLPMLTAELEESNNVKYLTVGTIHRFQGGEKNVLIFSSVVHTGEPHFLNSRVNLLNVVVSRAKHRLIFIGSMEALEKGPYTKILKNHLASKGKPLFL